MFGVGNGVGVICGSILGHCFYKKDNRLPALLMGVPILLTCVPMYFLLRMEFNDNGGSVALASFLTFLSGFLSIFPVPIERVILTNVCLPGKKIVPTEKSWNQSSFSHLKNLCFMYYLDCLETRGRANSFLSIIDDLGKGLGPFFLSKMISPLGRERAFNLSLIGWLIGGAITIGMFFTIRRDEEKVQSEIRDRLERHNTQSQPNHNT